MYSLHLWELALCLVPRVDVHARLYSTWETIPILRAMIVRRDSPNRALSVIVQDRLQGSADIGEQLADLLPARGQTPLGEIHLGIRREQIENGAAGRGNTTVVERLQIFQSHGFSLLVGHSLLGDCHRNL